MESKGLLLCSQDSTSGPQPVLYEDIPHPHPYLFTIHFNIILP